MHWLGAPRARPTIVMALDAPQGLQAPPSELPILAVAAPEEPKPATIWTAVSAQRRDADAGATRERLSGSAWALGRSGDAGLGLRTSGQLGGSQVGMRVFWEPGPRGFALTGRISTPLGVRLGREASVGLGYRTRFGGILLERRIGLDRGGRDAMALTAFGGVSDVGVRAGFRLDAYAQAGLVGFKSRDRFIDGAVRVERTLLEANRSRLSAGAGIWGGAQPGISRIDAGPQLVALVPVGAAALRISAEWRARIAGNAAPGSGPSVTAGFDF